jgi:hypothetical protein
MRMLRPTSYKDIESRGHYLTLSTQEIETIGLEESTLSYFALMSQLAISLPKILNLYSQHFNKLRAC